MTQLIDLRPAAVKAAEASPKDTIPFVKPSGTWLDPYTSMREPDATKLLLAVLEIVGASENRRRKRRPQDELNHQNMVLLILANALRCFFHREGWRVAYLRKADGYKNAGIDLSGEAIGRNVDLLAQAGLLKHTIGERGRASTFVVTKALFDVFSTLRITEHSLVHNMPLDCLVRLSQGKGEAAAQFAQNDQTRAWGSLLEQYNNFVIGQDIGLRLSREEEEKLVAYLNANNSHEIALYRPELIKKGLYRKFTNGTFADGGRLYGAWWINIPGEYRKKIIINGKPTVELDYAGCAIRMLYHQRGIDYQEDPYRIDEIVAAERKIGQPEGYYREAIKKMTQALINSPKDGHPEKVNLNNRSFVGQFNRKEVAKMIEEKHQPIAEVFRTGEGLRLQRLDSDIALAIITELREDGIVALPVHDSFIVNEEYKDKLMLKMTDVYRNKLQFLPIIK